MQFKFQSSINAIYSDELSELLFFNINQINYKEHIIEAINNYGSPVILTTGDKITVNLNGTIETHTLFLIGTEGEKEILLGVAVFFKKNRMEAILLHIAVNHRLLDSTFLTLQLILEVKKYLKNITGIKNLSIFYSDRITSLRIS